MSGAHFRDFLPDPRTASERDETPETRTERRLRDPGARQLLEDWERLVAAPYVGITTDGTPIPGLFGIQPNQPPIEAMVTAARALLARLEPGAYDATWRPLDSDLRRRWQNTALYAEPYGLRLWEHGDEVRGAVMAVVRASLSASGFEKARNVMRLNAFLGELVGAPRLLGEWTYRFLVFGTPHAVEPWGWQLFGHHLALNCFVVGGQLAFTPAFLGAEPAQGDAGPFAGIRVFADEERDGLALMRSMTTPQRSRVILYDDVTSADLPPGRIHRADHLSLLGAYQDNRIVPYEGLPGSEMTPEQRRRLLELVGRFVETLPPGPFAARLDEVERHLDQTHFCWIGKTDDVGPFYYRVQSPVVAVEFDHHSGAFLTNEEPERFHIHTIVRTPNGNDYGIDLLRQHYADAHSINQVLPASTKERS
jgi:hypothetical protein